MCTYKLQYTLRFNTYARFENVCFDALLLEQEIDSLCFLFSKYFDQSADVNIRGLTFFTEFNKCILTIKTSFENQTSDQTDNMHNIKNIFSIFLRDEFIKQVPHFRTIMQYLKHFYKPIVSPDIKMLMCSEKCKHEQKIQCFECKCKYLSCCLSTLDVGLQDGWDIFLRPMFGLPLMLYVLLKTDFKNESDIINENNIITQIFIQFFYNLICDKAYTLYTKHELCVPFVKECQKATMLLRKEDQERLLSILNMQCNAGSSGVANGDRLLLPFKSFMIEMGRHTKMKKVNKIASTVLIGFYLRHYLEGLPGKMYPVAELELRNVCRFILAKYSDDNINVLIEKLKMIKLDICNILMSELIVPETFIRHIITKYNLDNEISLLVELNHDCFNK
ncbi:P48 [Lonomia obliqua multiple nucleopolyhedrovirus]|uniref:p48 n=1 Tax=Lonomia obliqua multiple nucleopolyhedrovirus TaxID=134394 RepID=A0A126FC83_9ABAC|nr:P48 [Lonomia obliqua multiple nucleopolyhedrovirus]AKN80965.1 P48 [Lonomia obliqua multiple nucleopolyhedrovirus]